MLINQSISYGIVDDVTEFCYRVSNLTQISGTQGQMSRCKEIPSKTPFNFFSFSKWWGINLCHPLSISINEELFKKCGPTARRLKKTRKNAESDSDGQFLDECIRGSSDFSPIDSIWRGDDQSIKTVLYKNRCTTVVWCVSWQQVVWYEEFCLSRVISHS